MLTKIYMHNVICLHDALQISVEVIILNKMIKLNTPISDNIIRNWRIDYLSSPVCPENTERKRETSVAYSLTSYKCQSRTLCYQNKTL